MQEIDWYSGNDNSDELLDPEEEIFQYISDIVVTYPQEISNKLGYSLRTVQHHLRKMYNANRIGTLSTPFDTEPERIHYRRVFFGLNGLSGRELRNRTWYCVYQSSQELEKQLFDERGLIFHIPNRSIS
jgi:hypothetical protein